jgi:hypothetical protein
MVRVINVIPYTNICKKKKYLQVYVNLLFQMVLTLYHNPYSFPSRAALLVARAVGVDVTVKNINLLQKEQLNPEFTAVSTVT